MPELLSEDDISYMREQLCLGATEQEAAEVFFFFLLFFEFFCGVCV